MILPDSLTLNLAKSESDIIFVISSVDFSLSTVFFVFSVFVVPFSVLVVVFYVLCGGSFSRILAFPPQAESIKDKIVIINMYLINFCICIYSI